MTFGHKLGVPARKVGDHLLKMLCEALGPIAPLLWQHIILVFQEGIFDLKKSLHRQALCQKQQ